MHTGRLRPCGTRRPASVRPGMIQSLRFRQSECRAFPLGDVARHFEAPTIFPDVSLIAETMTETAIALPSLHNRTVSNCRMLSPRRTRARISTSSGWRSGGSAA